MPLFVSDGTYYRWAHKSIQEYFAAQFIFLDSQNEKLRILRAMAKSDNISNYINVLDLYYDIDYKTFRQSVILDLINNFIQYYDSRTHPYGGGQAEYHRRKLATYGYTFVIFPRRSFPSRSKIIGAEIRQAAHDLIRREGVLPIEWLDKQSGFIKEFNQPGNKNIIYAVPNFHRAIIHLLREKKETFIIYDPTFHTFNYTRSLDFDKPFVLSNNDELEANHRLFFDGVTEMLFAAFRRELFDIAKCRVIKTKIEKEIEKESNTEYLTEDI